MRRPFGASQGLRVSVMDTLFSRVHEQFAIVCTTLESDESMQDREALEGWKQALKWVLQEIDRKEEEEE